MSIIFFTIFFAGNTDYKSGRNADIFSTGFSKGNLLLGHLNHRLVFIVYSWNKESNCDGDLFTGLKWLKNIV